MKYIKQLNINFNDWEEIDYKPINITKTLLCYLFIITGHSRITMFIDENKKKEIFKYKKFPTVYQYIDFYLIYINEIDNYAQEQILWILNNANIKNIDKYKFTVSNIENFMYNVDFECNGFNKQKLLKYFKKYFLLK